MLLASIEGSKVIYHLHTNFYLIAGLVDRSSVHTSCKNIIQYLLKTLPVAGENYLVVFKLIHDLCLGELSLSNSDISLLIGHVELSPKQDEEEEEGKGTAQGDPFNAPFLNAPSVFLYYCRDP